MIHAWELTAWLNKINHAHSIVEQMLKTAPVSQYGELLQASIGMAAVRDGLMKHAISDVEVEEQDNG